MSSGLRRQALAAILATQPALARQDQKVRRLAELYGMNVFGEQAMREHLPEAAFKSLQATIRFGKELDPHLADLVANAMKEWAVERGATHFTHWFQPMTGSTAEKHDAFLKISGERLLLEFSGKELVKGEPDASSFPSGGIRSTFEARGYTAWDPTSPAFIREGTNGSTLCIPTAFCSWTGEALDTKTPLLRSMEAINLAALKLLQAIGRRDTRVVYPTLGCEQEYFLIDRNYFLARPDLVASGRSLLGARPPKGQELEDHYFGTISPRVLAFMEESEHELWKLGVPVKTRHNEVAPSQYEVAPIFERSSLAIDHNMLTMDIMKKVALRHGFVCLLHEKPFAGINGSGKHNNFSMATDQGENLLDPGTTPAENMRFVVFLAAVLRAVHVHSDLLRITVAHAGNDHRLGANEAPPAIISVFLGSELTEVVNALVKGTNGGERKGEAAMRLGVSSLPPLPKDATDRNRTSPFAFTGNKFEFRAVGSSQSPAGPNIVLNTIVAESMTWMAGKIAEAERKFGLEAAIQQVTQQVLKDHMTVVFNGNGYSKEWEVEAERRGLPNLRNTVDALSTHDSEKNFALFETYGVFSRTEWDSRGNIAFESYEKAIHIEALSLLETAQTMILPAVLKHQERLAAAVGAARSANAGVDLYVQENLLKEYFELANELIKSLDRLRSLIAKGETIHDGPQHQKARFFRDEIRPAMEKVRGVADQLELQVDDALWPLPKYREMLFLH